MSELPVRFRSCPSCRGQAKLTITVACPECQGEGTITDRQIIGKLGDMISPETMEKLARMLVQEDRDKLL
jgi:DnaJ-class molecular chaperone